MLTYTWKVEFRDGTSRHQYNGDGKSNKFPVDRLSDIKVMNWVPSDPGMKERPNRSYTRIVLEGEKPIMARHQSVPLNKTPRMTYLIGVEKKTESGETEKDIVAFSVPFAVVVKWPGHEEHITTKNVRTVLDDFVIKYGAMFED